MDGAVSPPASPLPPAHQQPVALGSQEREPLLQVALAASRPAARPPPAQGGHGAGQTSWPCDCGQGALPGCCGAPGPPACPLPPRPPHLPPPLSSPDPARCALPLPPPLPPSCASLFSSRSLQRGCEFALIAPLLRRLLFFSLVSPRSQLAARLSPLCVCIYSYLSGPRSLALPRTPCVRIPALSPEWRVGGCAAGQA